MDGHNVLTWRYSDVFGLWINSNPTESSPVLCCAVFRRVQLFATPWTVARQAPLSMGLPRREYWSGLPFSSLADLPHPGIKPPSLASPALAGRFFTTEPPGKAPLPLT